MLKKIKPAARVFLLILSISFFSQSVLRCDDQDIEQIIIGEAKVFSTQSPTRVVIGNPKIADVGEVTNKEITIIAKSPGTTGLVYWDVFGEQSVKIRVISQDMNDVKIRIDNLLSKLGFSEVRTEAVNEEGKVLLLGKFNNLGEKDRAFLAIGPLKAKVVNLTTIKEDEAVIEIDVQVLELQKGSSETLGFTWPQSMTIQEMASAATTGTTWGMLYNLGNVSRGAFSLKLDALVKEGKARILSRPRLSCLSGKEAKLLVGGEVPILSASVTGGGAEGTTATPGSVEYKEYGIKLNMKPIAKENGRIYIGLSVEVSEVGTAVETTFALAYPFTKRNANTELYLDDGQTMAIGGLIKKKTEEDLTKFPWLADIPVLGLFFRSRNTKEGKGFDTKDDSELFITLTPRIVNSESLVKKPRIDSIEPVAVDLRKDLDFQNPLARYAEVVKMKLVSNLSYPPEAKAAGFNGAVKLKLHISFQGQLLDAMVQKSSGFNILDESALKAARSIAWYPPFPPAIKSQDVWVEIPIVFRLD